MKAERDFLERIQRPPSVFLTCSYIFIPIASHQICAFIHFSDDRMRRLRLPDCVRVVGRRSWLSRPSTRLLLSFPKAASAYFLQPLVANTSPRWQSTSAQPGSAQPAHLPAALPVATTIGACPGCGGLAQTVEKGEAGHYSPKRKAVRSYIEYATGTGQKQGEDKVLATSLESLDPGLRQSIGLDEALIQSKYSSGRVMLQGLVLIRPSIRAARRPLLRPLP